jgi:hypothetical protein
MIPGDRDMRIKVPKERMRNGNCPDHTVEIKSLPDLHDEQNVRREGIRPIIQVEAITTPKYCGSIPILQGVPALRSKMVLAAIDSRNNDDRENIDDHRNKTGLVVMQNQSANTDVRPERAKPLP